MKRALVAAVAALLTLTANPASATTLPTAVTVKDPRNDVIINWGGTTTNALDVHWVRGTRVGSNLVFTIKVKNFTKANTAEVVTNGVHSLASNIGVDFRADGHPYQVYNGFRGSAHLLDAETMDDICPPEVTQPFVDSRALTRVNLATDRMRLIVPLDCVGNPKVARITYAETRIKRLDPWQWDGVGHHLRGLSVAASPRFSVR